jgi:hypothetical protein
VPSVGRQSAPVLAQYAAKLLGQHTGLHVGVELFDRAILGRSLTLRRCPLTMVASSPNACMPAASTAASHSRSLSTVPYRTGCASDDGAPEAKRPHPRGVERGAIDAARPRASCLLTRSGAVKGRRDTDAASPGRRATRTNSRATPTWLDRAWLSALSGRLPVPLRQGGLVSPEPCCAGTRSCR